MTTRIFKIVLGIYLVFLLTGCQGSPSKMEDTGNGSSPSLITSPAESEKLQATPDMAGNEAGGKKPRKHRPSILYPAERKKAAAMGGEIKKNPGSIDLYARRAWFYTEKFHNDEALNDLEQIKKLSPESPWLDILEARRVLTEGDKERAIKLSNDIIERNPGRLEAYRLRANVYSLKNDFKSAINDLEKCRELNPRDYTVYRDLCLVYMLMGKYGEARTNIDKAVKMKPGDWELYSIMANLDLSEGDIKRAKADLEKVIQLEPDVIRARIALARLLEKQGKKEEALKMYEEIIAKFGDEKIPLVIMLKKQLKKN